jgi:hypothetical protein
VSQENNKPSPSTRAEGRDWHELAEKASHENDPKKLIDLVQRLCDVLDEERAARAGPHSTTATKDGATGAAPK